MRTLLNRLSCFGISLLVAGLLSSTAAAQVYLGNVTGLTHAERVVTLQAGEFSLRFLFYRPRLVRVDFLTSSTARPDTSFTVQHDTTETVPLSFSETDSLIQFSSGELRVICSKKPARLRYIDERTGETLLAEPSSGGVGITPPYPLAAFMLDPDVHFYGTGERGIGLDLRGEAFDSYNVQTYGYSTPLSTMNINVPFLASSGGVALFFDNTYRGRFDLGASDPGRFTYTASGGQLTYYLIAAPTVREQLEAYTWLTGRQPLPPRWALGYIQSKFGYRNETEARAMVDTMRQKRIPCDAIVLDLYWFSQMGDLSWNTSSWPNPQQMMGEFLGKGIKTIVITEPYITQYSQNYFTAAANGFLALNSQHISYELSNWWSCGCYAGLLDITNPVARAWWWSLHPPFLGQNLAGFWTDLGEPERHPTDMQHYLGSTARVHNVYNLLWAQTIYEGFRQFRPNQRIFNLTRSGFAGIQRYGAIPWSGDVGKSFGGLAVQIPMMLNMGMSGLAYHNSDIGGFCCGTTTPELFVRWLQYGTFCPITRAHGGGPAVGGRDTEPWTFGDEAERIAKKYIELRYQLLPYIYSLAHQNSSTGLPLARPLFFDWPDDPRHYADNTSYMFGDAIFASPVVVQGQTSKSVYLPEGKWVDYWTGETVQGRQTVSVPTPLETMPVFVRAGSILPMQFVMNYTNERPLDTLRLMVFPSDGLQAAFSLYEDDGETLEYQKGSYALTDLKQTTARTATGTTLTIDISAARGAYNGQPRRRVYLSEIIGIGASPTSVTKNGMPLETRTTYSELRSTGDGYHFSESESRLYIQTLTLPESSYQVAAENIALGVGEIRGEVPGELRLDQNFPNPFNPTTVIKFQIPRSSYVSLQLFDLLGRRVLTIIDDYRLAGEHETRLDGSTLPSGVYVYRLNACGRWQARRMVVVR